MHNLYDNTNPLRLTVDGTNYQVAAGTTDTLLSNYVDTLGYAGVQFVYALGAITSGAVLTMKLRDCATSGGSYADIAGTQQLPADTDDNKLFISDIYRPTKRYVKASLQRATQNAAVDCLFVILYNVGDLPPTRSSTVGGAETFNSPADGTA